MMTQKNTDTDKGCDKNFEHPLIAAIKDGVAIIQEVGDKVIKSEQTTFEVYFERKSGELDQLIVSLEKKKIGKYVAGEVSLFLEESDNFFFQADFYFKDATGAWIKRSVKSRSMPMKWFFLPEEQDRLLIEKKVTFEYNHP